jgi:hypothetical protein
MGACKASRFRTSLPASRNGSAKARSPTSRFSGVPTARGSLFCATRGTAADVLLWDGKAVERVDSMSGPNWQDTIRAGPYLQWTTDGKSVLVTGCNRKATKWWVETLDVTTKSRTQVLEAEAPILGLALAPLGSGNWVWSYSRGTRAKSTRFRLRDGWRAEGKPVPAGAVRDRQFALTYLPRWSGCVSGIGWKGLFRGCLNAAGLDG